MIPVPRCPVCGGSGDIRFDGLQDRLFGSEGSWPMRSCSTCGGMWLDPRPDADALAAAYGSYYTHDQPPVGDETPAEQPDGSLRHTLRSTYGRAQVALARSRFGYPTIDPVGRALAGVLGLWPGCRAEADLRAGHLPAERVGRVLDVGCGSGQLLADLVALGWEGVGLDPDDLAVQAARARGLEVLRGDLDDYRPAERFDAVTAIHVIEHVVDPHRFVEQVHGVLTDDGSLVVVTPNVGSAMLAETGASWRGLEPPRHLTLFSPTSLRRLLEGHGFRVERLTTSCRGANANWRASHDLEHLGRHDMTAPSSNVDRLRAELALLRSARGLRHDAESGEEIVLLARRVRGAQG